MFMQMDVVIEAACVHGGVMGEVYIWSQCTVPGDAGINVTYDVGVDI